MQAVDCADYVSEAVEWKERVEQQVAVVVVIQTTNNDIRQTIQYESAMLPLMVVATTLVRARFLGHVLVIIVETVSILVEQVAVVSAVACELVYRLDSAKAVVLVMKCLVRCAVV